MEGRRKKLWLLLLALVGFIALAVVFRESLGLVVFFLLAAATLVQLVRVALGKARPATAKQLGRALRDAFWGIG